MLWKHLGGAKRMGEKCNTITLYASQADPVIEAIERNGVCYSKEAYVRKKYQESAKIFTTAYSWFVREMEKYVKKPDGAEYPYWAFREAYNVDQSMGGNFLTLEVPLDEVLLLICMTGIRFSVSNILGKMKKMRSSSRSSWRCMGSERWMRC